MAALFCLGSGALLRYAFGSKHDQESERSGESPPIFIFKNSGQNHLARGVLGGLEKGDVLLADRGFCSYGLIGVLLARGVDSVMRLHHRRPHAMPQGTPLGEGDRLVAWTRPPAPRRNDPWAAQRPTLPASLAVRLVSFRVEVPGFRTEAVTLATTLLDAKQYPAQALAELYCARWNVELRYREIKTTMGADVLRCQSPAMIQKELCLHAIAYNLLRCVMQQAAQTHEVSLGRLSFKGTLDAVRHFADAFHGARGKPRRQRQLCEQLLGILAKDMLPWRPNRHEPRARKRRPKQYQLLNQPRCLMRAIPHKNRHRAADPAGLNGVPFQSVPCSNATPEFAIQKPTHRMNIDFLILDPPAGFPVKVQPSGTQPQLEIVQADYDKYWNEQSQFCKDVYATLGIDVHPVRLAPANDPDPKVTAARDALQTALKNNTFAPDKLAANAKAAYGSAKAQDHLIVVMVPAYFSGANSGAIGFTDDDLKAQNVGGDNRWCFVSLAQLKHYSYARHASAHEIGHALGIEHVIQPGNIARKGFHLMAPRDVYYGIQHKPDLDSKRFHWLDIQMLLITPQRVTRKYLISAP